MISALAWVPRGAAKPVAEEADPADVDLETSQVKLNKSWSCPKEVLFQQVLVQAKRSPLQQSRTQLVTVCSTAGAP